MNEHELRKALADLPLGGLRYYERTGSTNDVALAWATEAAPDLTLVCADEQTAGRGRGRRRWFTPPGAALAFSLVLRPLPGEEDSLPRFSGLGALAVTDVLAGMDLDAEVKWPNDILLGRRKVCGILAEAVWIGNQPDAVVLGIGLNILPAAVPPEAYLSFPATSLEAELHLGVDRLDLLRRVLLALLAWRPRLTSEAFLYAWEERLAFRGEQVEVTVEGGQATRGTVEGLDRDGSLRLRSADGKVNSLQFGEVHLRPVV
jgi:BirA family biotin operon repressor/biotin-[acetyl-CoA-carboxylase] ligase